MRLGCRLKVCLGAALNADGTRNGGTGLCLGAECAVTTRSMLSLLRRPCFRLPIPQLHSNAAWLGSCDFGYLACLQELGWRPCGRFSNCGWDFLHLKAVFGPQGMVRRCGARSLVRISL